MPVYQYKRIEAMSQVIVNIAENYFVRSTLTLRDEDFALAFIRPDHVAKLIEVRSLIGNVTFSNTRSRLRIGEDPNTDQNVSAQICFHTQPSVLIPQYIKDGLDPDCPEPLREIIMSWAIERHRVGSMLAFAGCAMRYLNDICQTVEAMNTLLPCIPAVLAGLSTDRESITTKRAAKLAQSTRIGDLPRLPREVKDLMQGSAALINSLEMINGTEIPPIPKDHFRLQCCIGGANGMGSYTSELDWTRDYRLNGFSSEVF